MRTVGILGGMGPEATVALMTRVLALVDASGDADHVPLLVDQNTQVPSRIAHLIEGTGPSPESDLRAMAKRLEAAGATALAMACNTAHHFAPAIRDAVSIPFLDIVDLSLARVPPGPVGIVGSPVLEDIGLFQRQTGPQVIYPTDKEPLLEAIRVIKRDGMGSSATDAVETAIRDVATRGAASAIIACTEFSMLSPQVNLPIIDALDVLASEIVAFATANS